MAGDDRPRLKDEVLAVLAGADEAETGVLLDALGLEGVELVREPAAGLVMMQARDCFETPFHLGEVLVTAAEVRRGGRPGHGTVLGDAPTQALLLACLDCLAAEEEAGARGRLAPHLLPLARRAERRRDLEARMAGSTRVDFQSMAEG